MQLRRVWLAVLALTALPAVAYANGAPDFALGNMPWLLLAEAGVVFLETGLLRRFFRLKFWEALKIAFLANTASFILGIFLPLNFFGDSLAYAMLRLLSDLHFSWDVDSSTAWVKLGPPYLMELTIH